MEAGRSLWKHQIDAIERAKESKDLGLFFEQGTGKTRTTIEILRRRYAGAGRLQKTLILCPQIVIDNWAAEFKMYSKIKDFDVVPLHGPQTKRVKTFLDQAGETLHRGKIFITNYEALQMEDLFKYIQLWKPEILICDESQRLKNFAGVRAKKTAAIADTTGANFILSGTPILNSPMDAYMQFRILDRGETFGKNPYTFRAIYFEDKNASFKGKQSYFPKWEPRAVYFPELQSKIQRKSLRVLKAECLDLPPLVRQLIYCEMNREQMRMYNEMKQEYVTWLKDKSGESKAVIAQLAVTKALRLQQIVSGFAKDELGIEHQMKDVPRLKVLEELLEDLTPNAKVIVWANFKENYKMIASLCDKLKISYREIHGDISPKEKQKNMDEFRKDDTVRVMIANQAAAGVGVNLVEASYAIYYSKNFSLEQDLQSEARNYRGGSEIHQKVTRIDLVCKGTIDELVSEALANKQAIADRILDWKL